MRDILSDLSDMLSDPDPVRRSQKNMAKPLPKRFYKDVSSDSHEDTYRILLDGRPVKTPLKSTLAAPNQRLADILVAEWDSQIEIINPLTMPMTRLINTAIDGVAMDKQAVFEDIVRFAGTDLLCYRAEGPGRLVDRQVEYWDPVLDWAQQAFGGRFDLIEGVMHSPQPKETIAAFSGFISRFKQPLDLAALHSMTSLTGSALLATATADGAFALDDVWKAAHVDEDWQIEQWGEDGEAIKRRADRFVEMKTAATVFHVD